MDDAVFGDAVLDCDPGEAINFDADKSAIACDINAQRLILEQCGEVDLRKAVSAKV